MRLDVLVSDTQAIRSIRLALSGNRLRRGQGALRLLSSWNELEERAERRLFDVAFVQPTFPLPSPSPPNGFRRLLALHEKLPPGSLIIYSCDHRADAELLTDFLALPSSLVLLKGIDDHPRTILRSLSRAWTQRWMTTALEPSFSRKGPEDRELVLALLAGWPPRRSVGEFAKRMGVSPRTLRRRLKKGSFPSSRDLIRWGRLMEALALKTMGVRSRARLASVLELAGPEGLSRLIRDLTGLSADDLLKDEAEDNITRRLLDQISA